MATYKVQKGETLSGIAKKFGIKDFNTIKTRSGNPNLIYAGEILNLPDAAPAQKSIYGGAASIPSYTQTPTPTPTPAPTGTRSIYGGAATVPSYRPNTPATPSDPIIPQRPVEAPPMSSLTATGQNYIKVRQDAGLAADELSIKKLYRDRGFDSKYGEWRGTDAQYKAMWLQDIQESADKLNERIRTEGITDDQGNVIQPPATQQQPPTNPASPGGGVAGGGSASNAPTPEFVQPTGEDYQNMVNGILEKVGTTDIAKLIQDFSGGELSTPELEISKEDRDAKLEELKAAAAQGLSKIQQGLAQRGMTFSGIRTEAEANFAADTLAKEAGIGREFAGKIIQAARGEQKRRETALQAAEDNYNDALEKMGYVYNPITNTIEKTLAREKQEAPKTINVGGRLFQYDPETGEMTQLTEGQTKIVNAGGNLFEYDPNTGEMTQLYEAPEKERNLSIHYFTDDSGQVTKVVSDPTTGEEVGRKGLGKLGKADEDGGGNGSSGGKFTATQLNLGAARANVPLDQFNSFDYETKNFFVSRGTEFTGLKADILDLKAGDKSAFDNKDEAFDAIESLEAPPKVKDMLKGYYATIFPNVKGNWISDAWGFLQNTVGKPGQALYDVTHKK